jgi:hypothetical protein
MCRIVCYALCLATWSTPAAASLYIHLSNGRFLILPDGLVLFLFAVVALGAICWVYEAATGASSNGLPEEIANSNSADYYDDQAARLRALKRKLDAETQLNDSKITAARTKAELDELSDIIRHDKTKRSLRRKG